MDIQTNLSFRVKHENAHSSFNEYPKSIQKNALVSVLDAVPPLPTIEGKPSSSDDIACITDAVRGFSTSHKSLLSDTKDRATTGRTSRNHLNGNQNAQTARVRGFSGTESGSTGTGQNALGISVHKKTDVRVYPMGIEVYNPVHVVQPKWLKGVVRGKIEGFSKHSRQRLRETLLKYTSNCPQDVLYDMTCTIPGEASIDDCRALWNRFQVKLGRIGCKAIWRIEMQTKRQMPHWHVKLWVTDHHMAFDVWEAWRSAIDCMGSFTRVKDDGEHVYSSRMALPGANEHAIELKQMKEESSEASWNRYLCDHASKKKQAQLGWQGRQWGVINKKSFIKSECEDIKVPFDAWVKVTRWLKRLTRTSFVRGRKGTSVFFGETQTHKRMIEFATSSYGQQHATTSAGLYPPTRI
jgi:hypothetical protein